MLMVGRLIMGDPPFIRCDSQMTLGTPDRLFGMHSNLPVTARHLSSWMEFRQVTLAGYEQCGQRRQATAGQGDIRSVLREQLRTR